jgi:predicted O-methyltransferase YrrM
MSMLKKSNFVEKMRVDDVLIELDAIVDLDMIFQLEEGFSMAFADASESQVSEMLEQLLEKLETRYTNMLESIQQLTGMLQEAN